MGTSDQWFALREVLELPCDRDQDGAKVEKALLIMNNAVRPRELAQDFVREQAERNQQKQDTRKCA